MKTTTRTGASNAPSANAADGIASMTASETWMPAPDLFGDMPQDSIFGPPESTVPLPSTTTTPEIRTDEPYFWRKTTEEDVKAAIRGSYLETICEALAKNYRGKAPFPLIFGQATLLMGITLTHQAKEPDIDFDSNGDIIPSINITPARLSRLFINTGYGNVPNTYVMTVAPSGAGKGMGCTRLVEALGYTIINDGSPEGIKDAVAENPHCLLEYQEFSEILRGKGSFGRLKKLLTDMFNAGKFNDRLSKRTNAPERSAPWFYPSAYAAIQPEMLNALGRELDIAQGLFGRFLIFTLSESDMAYSINACNRDAVDDVTRLCRDLNTISEIEGEVDVPDPEYNTKFTEPILAQISKKMRPLVLRYGNEYLPRIALMLAVPRDISTLSQTPPMLTTDHLERARVLLDWILTMAESALGTLTNLEGHARVQEDNLRKMMQLIFRISKKSDSPIGVSQISRNSNGTGWDGKSREALLNELSARGWIVIHTRNGQKLESVEKGCIIRLNEKAIPLGIL